MKNKSFLMIFLFAAIVGIYSMSTRINAASVDRRNIEPNTKKVFRIEVPQLVVASASTSDGEPVKINGVIRQITIGVTTNTNDRAATISLISDEGSTLFTSISVVTGTTLTPTVQQFMTLSATDLPLAVLVTGTVTVTANFSNAPGTSTGLVDVTLFGD